LRRAHPGHDEEARDIAQLAFVRAWENLSKYDAAWAFSTWVYRIASNLAIDVLRSRDSRDRTHTAHLRIVGTRSAPARRRICRRRGAPDLRGARGAPDADQRAAFVLREVEGIATAEVAEALGCSEATVPQPRLPGSGDAAQGARPTAIPEYLPRGGGR